MSKRMVDPTFWDDPTIGDLDGHAKYLFLYLISSPRGNTCGLYEVSTRVIQFHTGMTSEKIEAAMKVLVDTGRIVRSGNWVWIVNQFKHDHHKNNLLVRIQFLKILDVVPDLEFVRLIMGKYEVQLNLTHGSVEVQPNLSPTSQQRRNSFEVYSKAILSKLTPTSPEVQPNIRDKDKDHDNDNGKSSKLPNGDSLGGAYPVWFEDAVKAWIDRVGKVSVKAKRYAYAAWVEKNSDTEMSSKMEYWITQYNKRRQETKERMTFVDWCEGSWKRFKT